jgi:uncharacterized membrane protein
VRLFKKSKAFPVMSGVLKDFEAFDYMFEAFKKIKRLL